MPESAGLLIDLSFGGLNEDVRGAEMVSITLTVSGAERQMSVELLIAPQKSHKKACPGRILPLQKAEGALAQAIDEGAFGQISDG